MNETSIYIHYWYKKIINISHILFNPTHLIFFFFFAPFDVYPKLEKKNINPQKACSCITLKHHKSVADCWKSLEKLLMSN